MVCVCLGRWAASRVAALPGGLLQNTVFYTCRRPFGSGGQSRSSAPASSRRRGSAGGRVPLVRGEGGVGVACASALARGPVGGGRRPRFPSNSKGILEFPSKGTRRELERFWKYYASCRAQPATSLPATVAGLWCVKVDTAGHGSYVCTLVPFVMCFVGRLLCFRVFWKRVRRLICID